jgi:hypothetical protein
MALVALAAVGILFGLGFAMHVLFWAALGLAVLWGLGFVVRRTGRRWYAW